MANISEITIEVPLSGFVKKMKNPLKKAAAVAAAATGTAATGTTILTTGQYMGEKPTEKQTQKFITNEPPTTPAMSETQTTENKKGFPWWIVAAAGVGLILLNSNNKKHKK